MEITLNVNINAPELVALVKDAIRMQVKTSQPGAAAAPSPSETVADTTKAAPKTSKTKAAAPPPAAVSAGTPAAETSSLTREEVKARLSDYSADKRFGMDGVFALLKKYKVQRISDLPESDFVAFKAEIDDALAKPASDPMS